MDLHSGVEQAVNQQIGLQINAIAAIGLEQDGTRRQPVFHHDASIEAEIGADVDEDVRLERRRAARKFVSSACSAILAEISSPPTLAERTRKSAPKYWQM